MYLVFPFHVWVSMFAFPLKFVVIIPVSQFDWIECLCGSHAFAHSHNQHACIHTSTIHIHDTYIWQLIVMQPHAPSRQFVISQLTWSNMAKMVRLISRITLVICLPIKLPLSKWYCTIDQYLLRQLAQFATIPSYNYRWNQPWSKPGYAQCCSNSTKKNHI